MHQLIGPIADDHELVVPGQLHKLLPFGRRKGRPRGVVVHRDCVDGLGSGGSSIVGVVRHIILQTNASCKRHKGCQGG